MSSELPRKKEKLLHIGKQLIIAKGYTAATIDEICDLADITKGGFYYFFKSKEEFAQELLEFIWLPIQKMQEKLVDSDTDPLFILFDHIDYMVNFLPGDGRLMGILSQELGDTPVSEQISGMFGRWTQYLLEIVEATKNQHAPDADFSPQSVMEFIVMNVEGAPITSRQLGADALDHALDHLKAYLRTVFNIPVDDPDDETIPL